MSSEETHNNLKNIVYSKKEISEFCLKYDIGELTVKRKLEKGLSLQEIENSLKYINICGMLFKSCREVSEYFEVPYHRILKTLRNKDLLLGGIIKSPYLIKDIVFSEGFIKYKEVTYSSFYDIAKEEKIPYPIFVKSLNKSLCVEDTVNSLKRCSFKNWKGVYKKPKEYKYNPRKEVLYKGVSYPSLKDLCSSLGIPYKTISSRVTKGMSLEEALSLKIKSISKEVVLFGKHFKSVKEAYEYYGVPKNKVRYLMSKGLSREEAIKILKSV